MEGIERLVRIAGGYKLIGRRNGDKSIVAYQPLEFIEKCQVIFDMFYDFEGDNRFERATREW